MILAALSLAGLLAVCAPNVAPDTMSAIVQVESGGNPLALHDNTIARAYAPRDRAQAIATARVLLARGHSLDVGLGQVNSANFAGYHVGVEQMLDPCSNLHIGSNILQTAYEHVFTVEQTPKDALWGAISAYNTGSIFAGCQYVAEVVRQAQHGPIVPTISLLMLTNQNRHREVYGFRGAIQKSPPRPPSNPAQASLSAILHQSGITRTLEIPKLERKSHRYLI